MKLDDLVNFYSHVLSDLGFLCELESGSIKYWRPNAKGAAYIPLIAEDKKPIVLPIKERLREDDTVSLILHPLTEDILKGESYVFRMMKRQGNRMLDTWFRLQLLGLGAYINEHAKKVPKGKQRWLNQNPDWSEACQVTLKRLLKATTRSAPGKSLIGIYTHGTDAEFNGKSVSRVAIVSSALLGLLTDATGDVLGIKVPVKQRKPLIALFNTILPDLNDNAYSAGSNNRVAPYFDCYMSAWGNVSERLDEITTTFGAKTFFASIIPLPTYKWHDGINNLSKLSRLVPPQRGNIGDDRIGSGTHNFSPASGKINETAVAPGGIPTQTTTQLTETKPTVAPSDSAAPCSFGGLVGGVSQQPQQPNYGNNYAGGNSQPNYNNYRTNHTDPVRIEQPPAFGGIRRVVPQQQNNNYNGSYGNFGDYGL